MENYLLKRRLQNNRREIIKDSCVFVAGTVVAVAGVFGVIHFGKELIDFYQSGETLTFASRFAADWEEAKVGFFALPVMIGGKAAFDGGKKLKKAISSRKVLKKEIVDDERTYRK